MLGPSISHPVYVYLNCNKHLGLQINNSSFENYKIIRGRTLNNGSRCNIDRLGGKCQVVRRWSD